MAIGITLTLCSTKSAGCLRCFRGSVLWIVCMPRPIFSVNKYYVSIGLAMIKLLRNAQTRVNIKSFYLNVVNCEHFLLWKIRKSLFQHQISSCDNFFTTFLFMKLEILGICIFQSYNVNVLSKYQIIYKTNCSVNFSFTFESQTFTIFKVLTFRHLSKFLYFSNPTRIVCIINESVFFSLKKDCEYLKKKKNSKSQFIK